MARKYRVTTESGSVYVIDMYDRTMVREPGPDSGGLQGDGEVIAFSEISELVPGKPAYAIWYRSPIHINPTVRATTPIVTVEELDVPSAPDQPA